MTGPVNVNRTDSVTPFACILGLGAALLVGSAVSSPLVGGAAEEPVAEPWHQVDEEAIRYEELVRFEWKLEGFSGGLLRLLPIISNEGRGVLESRVLDEDTIDYRFRASFKGSPEKDFWIFRSVIDEKRTRTLFVQDIRQLGSRRKVIEADLQDQTAMDIIAGLHWLRVVHPSTTERVVAWSDEKFYAVEVIPHGFQPYERDGSTLPVEQFTIQGIKEKGERYWKPQADIWLRVDADRMPVEVLYQKGVARVRLQQESEERSLQ